MNDKISSLWQDLYRFFELLDIIANISKGQWNPSFILEKLQLFWGLEGLLETLKNSKWFINFFIPKN